MGTISEETKATIDRVEPPQFTPEDGFILRPPETTETPAAAKPKGGRGNKGPNFVRNAKKKGRAVAPGAGEIIDAETRVIEKVEPPKTLVRGCRWILRNVVVMMETGYGWDRPEDYEEWLAEASPLAATCVQKHFPDWMDRWGDEILLVAMLMVWITPNASKKLRERAKQNSRNGGTEGKREDNPVVPFTQPA